jgi:hypothetical protein
MPTVGRTPTRVPGGLDFHPTKAQIGFAVQGVSQRDEHAAEWSQLRGRLLRGDPGGKVTSHYLIDTMCGATAQSRGSEATGRGEGLDGVVDPHRRRATEHAIDEKPSALAECADVGIRETEVRGHTGRSGAHSRHPWLR